MRFAIGTFFRQAIMPKGVLCLFVGLSLAACTRPQNATANIQLSLSQSDNSSLTTQTPATLKHVILQVTGGGVTTPPCVWDLDQNSNNNGDNKCVGDNTTGFGVDVQQGVAVTVQAIAVYDNSTDSTLTNAAMSIYYGDVNVTVNSASTNVPITVAQISNLTVNGRVMGRYLTGPDAGPTGTLNVFYVPTDGTPRMLVDHSTMTNGWMNTMMLSGVKLLYVVNDSTPSVTTSTTTTSSTTTSSTTTTGVTTTTTSTSTTTTTLPTGIVAGETVLWDGPVSLDSTLFTTANYLAKAAVPVSLRKTSKSDGSTVYEANDPTIYIWGYFGNATYASAKYVCIDSTTAFQNLKVSNATTDFTNPVTLDSTLYSARALLTASTSTMPATGALATIGSSAQTSVYFNGGMGSGTTPCTSATASTLFSNVYKVGVGLVDGNGNDGASGFRMPFTMTSFMPAAATVTLGTSPLVSISGQLLPGIQATGSSVTAMKGASSASYYDSVDCTQLSGFTAAGSGSVDSNGNFSISTSITAAELAGGTTAVVLCPSASPKAGQFLNSSLIHNGSAQLATHFTVTLDNPMFGLNQCHALRLNLLSATGSPGMAASTQNFAISLSGFSLPSAFQFYSDSSCTQALASQSMYTLPAMTTNATLYVMGTNIETSSPSIMLNDSPLGASQSANVQVRSPSTPYQFASPHLTMTPGQCQDVTVFVLDMIGVPTPVNVPENVTVAASDSGLTTVQNCTSRVPVTGTFSMASGSDYFIKFGIVANATVGAGSYVSVSVPGNGVLPSNVMVNTNVVNSTIMRASSGGTVGYTGYFTSGICEQMIIQRLDGSSNPITNEGPLPFTAYASTSQAKLYLDSGCSGSGASSVSGFFAANVGSMPIYVKESADSFSSSDSVTLNLQVPGANGSSTNNTMYKPTLTASQTNISSSCIQVTVSLIRPSDSAQISGVTSPVTNSSPSTLGVYNNSTDCAGSTNALTTFPLGLAVYMKSLAGTGIGTLTLQSSNPNEQAIVGTSPPLTTSLNLN